MKKTIRKQDSAGRYKLRGDEFDDIVIINSKDKQELIKALKEYCSIHEVVDYQFTSNLYIQDLAYYYYSVVIFYNKKGESSEVVEQPTKEAPMSVEEANEDIKEVK